MAGFWLFLLYSVGVVVNARYYYRRRHGLLITPGAQGTSAGTALSMIWPVTLFMESYRHPDLCTHPRHVVQRAANRQRDEEIQRLLRDEGH